MPRVLNLSKCPKIRAHFRTHGRWPAGMVYIGREVLSLGIAESKWRNRFKIGRDGTRDEVIVEYERWLYHRGLIKDVHELCGYDLLCWCAPEPCHGDVLLRLANDATRPSS
jgi:hypothetical protein